MFFVHYPIVFASNIKPQFDNFTIEDGLSQGTVYSIAQDKKGFMWFGTLEGLNRFDGYEFKSYLQGKNKQTNVVSLIRSLCVTRDGKLWLGGNTGNFGQFDYQTEAFIDHQLYAADSITKSASDITSIKESANGDLWVATSGDGVHRYNPGSDSFMVYRHNDKDNTSISSNRVNLVYIDSRQRLWIGTDDAGISRFDSESESFMHFQHDENKPDSLSHNSIRAIYEDSKHRLWIGTEGGGLNLWDEVKGIFTHYRVDINREDGITSNDILTIVEEQPGILWLGHQFKGLNRFHIKSERFEHIRSSITDKRSLMDDYIRTSFKDDEGLIWFGTETKGVSRFDLDRAHFNHYAHDPLKPDGLGPPTLYNFAAQNNKQLWIAGTGFDLFDRSTGKFTHYLHEPGNKNSLSSDNIIMMYLDTNEHLWITTGNDGLNDFDTNTKIFTHYNQSGDTGHKISSNKISSVSPYDEDHLWLGTYDLGVDLLNKKTGVVRNARFVQGKYNSNEHGKKYLLHSRIYTVLTDRKKRNWVITSNGLFELNIETMTFNETNIPLLNSIRTASIIEDVNGDLWIGSYGQGIFHFKPDSANVSQYSKEEGLCDATVYSLLEDNNGDIWVATNSCLTMLDIKTLKFSIYDKGDGIQDNEFNGNAAIKLPSGELVFGGVNGFNIFYPENVKTDARLPRVSLTDFFVFNQSVAISTSAEERELMSDNLVYLLESSITYSDKVILDYPFKMFGFSFAALNYKNSLGNQYKYKLDPWDAEWISTPATERVANYSNLPHGEYLFSVKAGTRKGIWNEQPTTLKVIILPPPWKTWWAIMLYILCLVSIILVALRVEQNKMRIKNRELEREKKVSKRLTEINDLRDEFLANTSHELRTPLNGIIGIAESLLDGVAGSLNKEVDGNLSMIVSSGKRLANLVNDILDFSKLKNHDLELQIANVELFSIANIVVNLSRPLIADKSLQLANTIQSGLYAVEADENRLQQIFHNLIGNAVKFTEKGEVSISAEQVDSWVHVRIKDSGIGIPDGKLESIFDSFEQAEGSTAREYGGTGLGLAVTKKLVELHGGKIYVESPSAEGSTFIFTLKSGDISEFKDIDHVTPNIEKVADVLQPETITSEENILDSVDSDLDNNVISFEEYNMEGEKNRFRILIVDDEPINRKVLNNHLKGNKYQLFEAKDGIDALNIINEHKNFDMILLDIMMPKMSGYEVCERLRKKYSVSDLPIIFLTAKNQAKDKADCFAIGGNDFLGKPVNKLELLSRVETHLKLLDINRNLERIVLDRTADLVEKNQQITIAQKRLLVQEKMAALGTITAGVAHEINNPTNFLYMTSRNLDVGLNKFRDFLFTIVDEDTDQEVLDSFDEHFVPLFKFTEILGEGTERLKSMVTDLRSFTRLDNSELKVMSMAENIETTINLVKVKYKEQVTIDLEVIDKVTIRCWPTRINQIFMNILINACQALQQHSISNTENPELEVSTIVKKSGHETSRIEVIVYRKDDNGIAEIRDNGCGMPKAVLEHIFEPFYTTKDVDEGTGLGMSIVQDIVHKHDGTIEVQSELGVGTTFILTFPLADEIS